MVRFTLAESRQNSNKKKTLSNFGGLFVLKSLWEKFLVDDLMKTLGIVKDTEQLGVSELGFLSSSQSLVGANSEKELADKTFFSGTDPCLCATAVAQKELNRFLNTDRFDFKGLFMHLTQHVFQHRKIHKGVQANPSKSVFIIDDSPLEKSGKKMQGLSKLYNSSKKGFYRGFELVALALTSKSNAFFLDFQLKPKSPKPAPKNTSKHSNTTKLLCAASMIDQALSSGITARFVTFDLWYTAVPFLLTLAAWKLIFVAPLKKNRIVFYHGKRRKVTYFLNLCRRTHEWGKVFLVDLPEFGPVHLSVFKRRFKNNKTTTDILITNGMKLLPERMRSIYQKRWTIETLFREAKQTFGLESFHNRNHHAIIAHLSFSLIAMLLVRAAKFFFKSLQHLTPGAIKKQLIQTLVEIEINMNQWKITFYESNRFLHIFKQLNLAFNDV